MKITEELIKGFEGFRAHPYLDSVGVPTIGWGNTFYSNGKPVTMKDPGISQEEGDVLFAALVRPLEHQIDEASPGTISDGQLAALTSFAYNTGIASPHGDLNKTYPTQLYTTTLWKKFIAQDIGEAIPQADELYSFTGAAGEFGRWIHAGTQILEGLRRRRYKEACVFTGVLKL